MGIVRAAPDSGAPRRDTRMRRFALLCGLSGIALTRLAQPLSAQSGGLSDGILAVEGPRGIATGILYDARGLVVTTATIAEPDYNSAIVRSATGERMFGYVVLYDPARDLLVVRFDPSPCRTCRAVNLSAGSTLGLHPGDPAKILYLGPQGLTSASGTVKGIGEGGIEAAFSAPTLALGAPVLAQDGGLAAIVRQAPATGNWWAIPAGDFERLLSVEPVSVPPNPPPQNPRPPLPAPLAIDSSLKRVVRANPEWPGAGLLFNNAYHDVVLLTPVSAVWLETHSDFPRLVQSCPGAFGGATLGADSLPISVWRSVDEYTADVPLVALTVTPSFYAAEDRCNPTGHRGAGSMVRGYAVLRQSPQQMSPYLAAGSEVLAVKILRGATELAPVLWTRGTLRATLASGQSAGGAPVDQLQLYLMPEQLSPDSNGRFSPLQIQVSAARQATSTVTVPAPAVGQAWKDLLPWRLSRLSSSPVHPSGTGVTPAPSGDPVVAAGVASYREGKARDAALTLHARLYGPALNSADLTQDRVFLTLSLLALDDRQDARVFADDLLQAEPCFTLAPGSVPDDWRRVFMAAAPTPLPGKCHRSMGKVLFASIIPGGGQFATGRAAWGAVLLGVGGISAALAVSHYSSYKSSYDKYQSATDPTNAQKYYDEASHQKSQAQAYGIGALAVIVVGGVEAALKASSERGAAHAVQNYGARPVVTAGGHTVGVGFEVVF